HLGGFQAGGFGWNTHNKRALKSRDGRDNRQHTGESEDSGLGIERRGSQMSQEHRETTDVKEGCKAQAVNVGALLRHTGDGRGSQRECDKQRENPIVVAEQRPPFESSPLAAENRIQPYSKQENEYDQ